MRRLTVMAIAAALSACSEPDGTVDRSAEAARPGSAGPEQAGDERPAAAGAEHAAAPRQLEEGPTVGGDGSPIRLSPVSGADAGEARLQGELACSFATLSGDPLLHTAGDVASSSPAQGIVKVADSVERIGAPGGFDGMLKGGTFAGKGKTIRVELVSAEPVGGGESPPYPATLTYQRADGASRTWEGLWTCGP